MDFLPGIAAGTTGCIIGHPFDAVKVRMQTNMYPTNYECVKQIITKEGIIESRQENQNKRIFRYDL